MAKPVHILWEGTQLAQHSFALVNRQQCGNIADWDVAELTLIPHEPDQFAPEPGSRLERLMQHDVRRKGLNLRERALRPHVWICHTWPPRPRPPGRDRRVIMLPWEYSQLPVRYVELLNGATEIWTPSRYSAQAFVDSGVVVPVHVVPNGVQLDIFKPAGERAVLADDDSFVFLYVGGTIYRKGIDLLLDAYTRAFAQSDRVRLVIKDAGTKALYRGQTAQDLITRYQAQNDAPQITYLDADLPSEQLAMLYRRSDVLVAPYRGEGFSLPTLEAMACGTPPIVTQGGATEDFVDAECGWKIPARRISVGRSIYGETLAQEGFLLEPQVDALARLLREVVQSRQEVHARSLKAAQLAQRWSWDHATLALLRRVDSLCGTSTVLQAQATLGELLQVSHGG